MLRHEWLFWVVGLVAVGGWAAIMLLSREAKMERRRRKSHSRLISKTNRPMVRFSVKSPPAKKRR